MNFDEFFDLCWKDLPPIRRGLAGRLATKRIMLDAILEWDEAALLNCKTSGDYQRYEEMILERVKGRSYGGKQYGFAIAIFVLMAIASAVIQWITLWWLNHVTDRESFETLRRSLQR